MGCESDMKIWAFLIIMVSVLTVIGAVKGQEKGKMDAEFSLPSQVEGWKWDGKDVKYNSKTLFDYIDGGAELYLAYGFQNATVRRFEKLNQPSITVELFEMASSEDAYGVFSFERQDEAAGIGQGSEFGGGLPGSGKGSISAASMQKGRGRVLSRQSLRWGRIRQMPFATSVRSRSWSVLSRARISGL